MIMRAVFTIDAEIFYFIRTVKRELKRKEGNHSKKQCKRCVDKSCDILIDLCVLITASSIAMLQVGNILNFSRM